ncbi:MAG TPA: Txe/YoeB family addiction module toxin [Tepidisphaeraceae bacterium]|nr:Txe/YoeB family addiction module toxin [Tepidisphaeraceae bacterium]
MFHPNFIEDLSFFVSNDRKRALKLLEIVRAVLREPFTGIGKPEPLKALGADVWSRRLTDEHRVVYLVAHDRVHFLQARYHY